MTVYRTHCGREFGTPSLLEEHNSGCGLCRSITAQLADALPATFEGTASLLRNADGETCGAKNGPFEGALTCVMPRGHKGDHIASGVAWMNGSLSEAIAELPRLKLLGIDPGLTRFGVAVAELPNIGSGRPRFVHVDVWRTEPSAELKRKLRKMDDTAERVGMLAEQLHDLVQKHQPIALCIEALALPYGKIQLQVAVVLGRVRGVVDALAKVHHLAVLEEMPQRLKKLATGKAGASKLEVQEALEREYPELRELWPPQKTLLEHAGDACAAIHACRGADVILAARAAAARAA